MTGESLIGFLFLAGILFAGYASNRNKNLRAQRRITKIRELLSNSKNSISDKDLLAKSSRYMYFKESDICALLIVNVRNHNFFADRENNIYISEIRYKKGLTLKQDFDNMVLQKVTSDSLTDIKFNNSGSLDMIQTALKDIEKSINTI